MKSLIVDDDFFCRRVLQTILANHGACHVAINAYEALFAFEQAYDEEAPYDVICLDIMMPDMDGQEALKRIRAFERKKGILATDGTKIIMATALDDNENIKRAFKEQCEAYLIKPISKTKLEKTLTDFGLI
jgi:two-component system chemotaxis response regulator CheY